MKIFECKNCQIKFHSYEIKGKPRVFCSNECREQNSNIFLKCQECLNLFKSKKFFNRKFCCRSCSATFNLRKRSDKSEKSKFKCKHCHKDFEILSCTARVREKNNKISFCSSECFYDSLKRIIPCSWCQQNFKPARLSSKFCCLTCVREWKKHKTKLNPGSWLEHGYRILYTEDGKGIKEHIKIMQENLGRNLSKDEVVHHINGDRLDNRIENLKVMTRGEHSKLHRIEEIKLGKNHFKKKCPENHFPITIEIVR